MKLSKSNILFCILAYLLTWFWIFLYSAGQANLIPFKIPPVFISLFGAFGPSLAGIIVICIYTGREGVKRIFGNLLDFRIGIKYFFIAVFFETALFTAIIIGSLIFDSQKPEINPDILLSGFANFAYYVFFCSMTSGLGEELGWRGFFLPNLQSEFSPLASSVIMSFVVSLWHLKSNALIELLKGDFVSFSNLFFPDMGQRILITIPVIIFIVYLFNKTGGSLLIMVLFHGSSNASFEWAKDIYSQNLPGYFFPAFIIMLWIIGLAFIPVLVKQKQKGEIVDLNLLLQIK